MTTLYDNAIVGAVGVLAAALTGVTVSGRHEHGVTPQIVVTSDGVTGRVRGVMQYETVRVVAWDTTDIAARSLAQRALSALDDAGLVPLTGPIDAVDPVTRAPICAATARAAMQGYLA